MVTRAIPMSSVAQPVTATEPDTTAPFAGVSIAPDGGAELGPMRTVVCTPCGELIAPADVIRTEPTNSPTNGYSRSSRLTVRVALPQPELGVTCRNHSSDVAFQHGCPAAAS